MNSENQTITTTQMVTYVIGGALVAAGLAAALNWINASAFGLGNQLSFIAAGAAIGLSFAERPLPKEKRRYQRLVFGIVLGASLSMILNWINEISPIIQLLFVFAGALLGLTGNRRT